MLQWRNLSQRPRGITFLSIAYLVNGIFFILVAIVTIAGFLSGDNSNPASLLISLYFPLGIMYLYGGRGLYRGKGWAWKFVVIMSILGLPVGIIYLIYLYRPTTKAYFGKVKID